MLNIYAVYFYFIMDFKIDYKPIKKEVEIRETKIYLPEFFYPKKLLDGLLRICMYF